MPPLPGQGQDIVLSNGLDHAILQNCCPYTCTKQSAPLIFLKTLFTIYDADHHSDNR